MGRGIRLDRTNANNKANLIPKSDSSQPTLFDCLVEEGPKIVPISQAKRQERVRRAKAHGNHGGLNIDEVSSTLLRPTEAAGILRIGRSTVYLMIREGRLPSISINRSIRIPRDALRLWIDDHTKGVSNAAKED